MASIRFDASRAANITSHAFPQPACGNAEVEPVAITARKIHRSGMKPGGS